MKNNVYLANTKASKHSESLVEKLYKLFFRAGFQELISEEDLIAIKLHFGEMGNTSFIRPIYIRRLVEAIKSCQGKPFLTDANTLYVGSRSNSVDHLNTAIANGFAYSTVQAPIVIADGMTGKNFMELEVNLKNFDRIRVGADIIHANGLISVSHFKGHMLTGFGGTIKNIGMGLGSRSGKQMMHSDVLPGINQANCVKCQQCVRFCPENAITITEDTSTINQNLCIGCGECVVSCTHGAIKISWEGSSQGVQEKMVEYTYGILKEMKGKAGFINFVMDITPDCDCLGWSDRPIVNNIGILASQDPVALEQASLDLVNKQAVISGSAADKKYKNGDNKFKIIHPDTDGGLTQLKYAEEIGLGSRKYELIEL